MEILTKYALEIFFGLVSAGALAFCKHLYGKNKKLNMRFFSFLMIFARLLARSSDAYASG